MVLRLVHRARTAAAAASRIAATAWSWLTRPDPSYPKPPYPEDRNMAGLGWRGGRPEYRPWGKRD